MGETPRGEEVSVVVGEAEVKYCPLAVVNREDGTHLPCTAGCAWWSEAEEACVVAVLAKLRPSGWYEA